MVVPRRGQLDTRQFDSDQIGYVSIVDDAIGREQLIATDRCDDGYRALWRPV